MHEILLDCEIQTDHEIPDRRPNLEIISKKKKLFSCGFCHSEGPLNENNRKRKVCKILGSCSTAEKVWNKRVIIIGFLVGVL